MSVPDIKIDNLERMLGPYARHHDLSVKITYYPNRNLRTSKSVINYDQDGSQGRKRLSIDIFGKEAIEGFRYSRMQIMRTILNDMHLHFNAGQPVEDPFAVEDYVDEWLTFLKLTDLDPGSEYDYNFLRVHRVKDGECSYVDFRIDIPTARESV